MAESYEQMMRSVHVAKDRSPSLLALVRKRMGLGGEELTALNDPRHDRLLGMDEMVARLHRMAEAGTEVVVMPDFDMDGVSSGVLLWAGLNEMSLNASIYIPLHEEGHDIQPSAVDRLVERFPGARAIITTDSGTNSHTGLARAKEHGLEVLVTDHHMQLPGRSPADLIINPARIDETYSHPEICGAFVAWQVLMAYAEAHRPDRIRDITLLRLFAGIGTVADVMPILYENRQVVRDSIDIARMLYVPLPPEDSASEYDPEESLLMQMIRSGDHAPEYISAFLGMAVMLKAMREHGPLEPLVNPETGQPVLDDAGDPVVRRANGKLRKASDIDEETWGWYLAPAFNSIRRTGGSMEDPFGVFVAPSAEEKLEHAKAVIDSNEHRKEVVAKLMEELAESEQPLAPHVYVWPAPAGMMGLVASRTCEASGGPSIVVAPHPDGSFSGSARAPGWFNIISEMTAAGFTAVGHEQACGVKMRNEAELIAFAEHLARRAQDVYEELEGSGAFAEQPADLTIGAGDGVDTSGQDLFEILDLAQSLQVLRPFGHGFPPPEIELVVDLSQASIQAIGSERTHLRIGTPDGLKALWWSAADMLPELRDRAGSLSPEDNLLRLRGRLELNEFRGVLSPQIMVEREAARHAGEDE